MEQTAARQPPAKQVVFFCAPHPRSARLIRFTTPNLRSAKEPRGRRIVCQSWTFKWICEKNNNNTRKIKFKPPPSLGLQGINYQMTKKGTDILLNLFIFRGFAVTCLFLPSCRFRVQGNMFNRCCRRFFFFFLMDIWWGKRPIQNILQPCKIKLPGTLTISVKSQEIAFGIQTVACLEWPFAAPPGNLGPCLGFVFAFK